MSRPYRTMKFVHSLCCSNVDAVVFDKHGEPLGTPDFEVLNNNAIEAKIDDDCVRIEIWTPPQVPGKRWGMNIAPETPPPGGFTAPRFYRHWKHDGIYELLYENVLDVTDTDQGKVYKVVYRSNATGEVYVRDQANFFSTILVPSPQPHYIERFRLMHPEDLIDMGLM